ncbi:MAG: thioredoxin family protein [Thermomonas sp.]|uniref:protein-disulfide reductase DsbD family protein n=1 Tax=Thermomonas sp. TaxID=1971895 RepID=UPI0026094DCC|nr:protein-disulfide reductase DsbD [Thermomonas sp.]MCC7097671.1 thioredoxin family protein [Thermomonas sp.]
MTDLPIFLRRWLAAALLFVAALPAPAQDVELPPVDQVFVLSAQATARDRIAVRWKIADGFYLYRHQTAVKASTTFRDAQLALPEGAKHHDRFFGDVQTYRQTLVGVLTGTPLDGAASVTLTVKYQGCADAGVCYPPQTRTLTVPLPAENDPTAGLGFGRGPGTTAFGLGGGNAAGMPLPENRAFTSEVIALDGNSLLLRLTPAKGYYIYRDKLSAQLQAGPGLAASLPPAARLPKATPYRDEHFGNVAVYFDQVEIPLAVTRDTVRAATGTLVIGLQGCQDNGICYPPMTRTLAVSLPAGRLGGGADGAPPVAATATTPAATVQDAATRPQAETPMAAGGVVPPAPEVFAAPDPVPPTLLERTAPPQQRSPGLLLALVLALLGGLILNLMPCVLPVLSLKVLSLAQGGESRQRAHRHALAYTAGVLASMLALGGLILALRSDGLEDWISWGFQLQFPRMVAVLGLLMFVLGLSLSGLWYAHVRVGQRAGALAAGQGVRADFFTGVLAVILATPCTAPFMGAALAYAFIAPTTAALLVFLMLGLGLALPFLLIAFIPGLARLLPKPGAWMETLKQLLAFPMYATAAWLVWVLAHQRGADAVGLWLTAAILLALAAWAWTHARRTSLRWPALLAVVALVAAIWPIHRIGSLPVPQQNHAQSDLATPYSEARLAELLAQNRVVFVNMTAEWCVSCKANEKAVFSREGFRNALAATDAVYMIGDYTNVDPAISAYLKRYGAVGVPLYVVYPRGGGEGRVLPVLLTPSMAADALAQAAR